MNFHGEQRSNDTHAIDHRPGSPAVPKGPGKEAKLNYLGHVLMENRHGLAVQTRLTQATGTAEREAAVAMIAAQAPGAA